jgi:hypothetical protein
MFKGEGHRLMVFFLFFGKGDLLVMVGDLGFIEWFVAF